MLQFVLDTDHLTLFQHDHEPLMRRLAVAPAGSVGTTVVTLEESTRGRLAVVARARTGPERIQAYQRLLNSFRVALRFPVVAFDQLSEDRFQHLRSLRLHIGTPDLKIAAVALANNLTVLTRNVRDFGRVPGLAIQDWSVDPSPT